MKTAVTLDLTFEPVKKVALELGDLSTAQAGHVNVITLGPSFVEVLLALHVHEIKFVHQAMAFQKLQRPVNGDSVDASVQAARLAKDLTCVQMLFRRFHHSQDGAALSSQSDAARGECCLQSPGSFGFGKWHRETPTDETQLQSSLAYPKQRNKLKWLQSVRDRHAF
jgi:hypothetical protein